MPVMSVRLSDEELKRVKVLAQQEHKEKSSIVRELLTDGLRYKLLMTYRDGHISLSGLTRTLGMSFSEAVDLLATFGLQAPVSYDDYLRGLDTARKVFRS